MKITVKRKVALLFAYNGANFSGNQVQTEESVRTVEPELEKALYNSGCIAESNYKSLSKIKWSRASRTDKGVHAISTVVGAKLLFDNRPGEALLTDINSALPIDIRLIAIKPVVQSFNAKVSCSYREYQYLFPFKELCPEQVFTSEAFEQFSAITTKFQGTHNFHNYTRNSPFSSPQSTRYVVHYELDSVPVTYEGTQYLRFVILGQSFLYHQIRKMIGMTLSVFLGRHPLERIHESFEQGPFHIPLAPASGLCLSKILFSHYNNKHKHKPVEITTSEDQRIAEFYTESILPTIHSSYASFTDWAALEFRSDSN